MSHSSNTLTYIHKSSEPEITVGHRTISDYYCQLSDQKSPCLGKASGQSDNRLQFLSMSDQNSIIFEYSRYRQPDNCVFYNSKPGLQSKACNHTYPQPHAHTRIHTNTHMHIHAQTRRCIHTYAHIHVHVYTRTHIHISITSQLKTTTLELTQQLLLKYNNK